MTSKRAQTVTASAPGKIIVSGEHFVVQGAFAVVAAICNRARVTVKKYDGRSTVIASEGQESSVNSNDRSFRGVKSVTKKIFEKCGRPQQNLRIEIESEIPSGSGLGSSAAVCVAASGALCRLLNFKTDTATIFDFAMEGEKTLHGNPSGVDVQASLCGGVSLFNRKSGAKSIPLSRAIQFIVANSGHERNTNDLIERVERRRRRFPATFDHLVQTASFLSLQAAEAISEGDLPYLGALMNAAQTSLNWLGVSTSGLNMLLEQSLIRDVFGAKITGAGGGGSIIILPKPEKYESVLTRISKDWTKSFATAIPQKGLQWEN